MRILLVGTRPRLKPKWRTLHFGTVHTRGCYLPITTSDEVLPHVKAKFIVATVISCPSSLFSFLACGDDFFGRYCSKRCSVSNPDSSIKSCRGILMCLPDPYGCSCGTGFMGPFCNQSEHLRQRGFFPGIYIGVALASCGDRYFRVLLLVWASLRGNVARTIRSILPWRLNSFVCPEKLAEG